MPSKSLWQPCASVQTLKKRAQFIADIRAFFAKRKVCEVFTPSISQATVTDVHLCSLQVSAQNTPPLYLQTSPEFHMKRLLAYGMGDIYQICNAFRDDEQGKLHNIEFSLLEWYRLGFDHFQLMDEVDELLQTLLGSLPAKRLSYRQAFQQYLGIDPFNASDIQLNHCVECNGLQVLDLNIDENLQYLMSHCIEPQIAKDRPCIVYDFPPSQAALAKLRKDDVEVASRFEVYYQGVELANGFHELTDAKEQRARFEADLNLRSHKHQVLVPIDENFLASLDSGLPDCAGVALGIDRLFMLAEGLSCIEHGMSFTKINA